MGRKLVRAKKPTQQSSTTSMVCILADTSDLDDANLQAKTKVRDVSI